MALFPMEEMSNTVVTPHALRILHCSLRLSVVFLEQLEVGLDQIRALFGSEEQSGFTDSYIRESLCDYNFDVNETVELLTGMYIMLIISPTTNPDPSRRGAGEKECCPREKR